MVVLEARSVSVSLGGNQILNDIDLDVKSGSWVSIVGPNGAGKTTLIRVLTGTLVPDSGSVQLLSRDIGSYRSRDRAQSIAVVPQIPVVPSGLSVLDYALLGRTPHVKFFGSESAKDLDLVWATLERLGISHLAGRVLDSCSGGERQRVFLARALVQDAPVLLLDEPTSSLDIGHQQEVLDLIDSLRRERSLTVVSTMHDLTLAGLYADELVLLSDKQVVERGVADEVLTEEILRKHFGARVRVLPGSQGPVVVPHRDRELETRESSGPA